MTATVTEKVKKIKVSLAFARYPDPDLQKQFDAIYAGMNGNVKFPNPPVDMPTFKAGLDSFSTLATDALDGGKKVTSAKRKQRTEVIKMATQLGHYVESVSNNDLATFNSSGFVAATNVRTAPGPLPPATFKYIDRGATTGQIVVKVTGLQAAVSYDLRYAAAGTGGALGPWIDTTLLSPKAITLSNLTPGTTCTFQVRALGKLGYTDWSDPTTFICA